MADRTLRRQPEEPRKGQRGMDTINEMLLASGEMPSEKETRRNIRSRTMRLWNDQVCSPTIGPETEDVSMLDDYDGIE